MAIPADVKMVLERMARKAPKFVVGLAPAIPLYSYCSKVPEDGVILRYMFIVPGILRKALIYIPGVSPQKQFAFRAELFGTPAGRYVDATIRKEQIEVELELPVEVGNRLTIFTPTIWETPIEFCALFFPSEKVASQIKVLREAIEEKLDEGIQSEVGLISDGPAEEGTEPA